MEKGGNAVSRRGVRVWERGVPALPWAWGGPERTGRGVPARGASLGEEAPALGAEARTEGRRAERGVSPERLGGGRAPESAGARRGRQPRGDLCGGAAAIPGGRVGSRPGCVSEHQGSHPARGRGLPAALTQAAGETVHLAGKRRARGSAGRALHSADRVADAEPARSLWKPPGSGPRPRPAVRRPVSGASASGPSAAAARATSPRG